MKSENRLRSIYHNMKSRCYLSSYPKYKYYGGRGIKICDEWLGKYGFKNFYNWAILSGYKNGLTIDRINNNGNYEPSNCRWVDQTVQNNNTNFNHYVTFNNETKSVSEWAKIYNIHRCVLNNRLRRGWKFEDAVVKPVRQFRKYNNMVLSSKDVNINKIKEDANG